MKSKALLFLLTLSTCYASCLHADYYTRTETPGSDGGYNYTTTGPKGGTISSTTNAKGEYTSFTGRGGETATITHKPITPFQLYGNTIYGKQINVTGPYGGTASYTYYHTGESPYNEALQLDNPNRGERSILVPTYYYRTGKQRDIVDYWTGETQYNN